LSVSAKKAADKAYDKYLDAVLVGDDINALSGYHAAANNDAANTATVANNAV